MNATPFLFPPNRETAAATGTTSQIPIVVIGNKIDLAKRDRAVSKEEGKSLAGDFNAKFLEVSVSFYFVD